MAELKQIAAIILAAGSSHRIKDLKPLLPLGETTLVGEAVDRFRRAGITDVRVVVGHRHAEFTPILGRLGVPWVLNAAYYRGMLSSVLAGVQSLPSHVEAFFLLPVDIPLVKPKTLEALLQAYLENGAPVIYPRFRGRRGHPPLIARCCITDDLAPDFDGGLQAFLTRYESNALNVDVADEGILMNCNTLEDYDKIKKYRARGNVPTARECRAIWRLYGTTDPVIAHSVVVAEVARLLAVHLNTMGLALNANLVVAASYLHDLDREKHNHAEAAAAILQQLGYPELAEVVASHMDIEEIQDQIGESEIIYLADKCVRGERLHPLAERFARSLEQYAVQTGVRHAIQRRWQHAETIKAGIERILGQSIEAIPERHARSIRAALAQGEKTIYLVRHGAMDVDGEGKHFIGQLDLPLNKDGVCQAKALRERLKDVALAAVYCSDLQRALETARIISEPHGLEPQALPNLREIALGDWEGKSFEEIGACYPDAYQERGRDIIHYRTPGGESFLDCTRRVIPTWYKILHATHGNTLIVGHIGVNRIILCQALGWSVDKLFEIRQDYGCLNSIHCEDRVFEVEIING